MPTPPASHLGMAGASSRRKNAAGKTGPSISALTGRGHLGPGRRTRPCHSQGGHTRPPGRLQRGVESGPAAVSCALSGLLSDCAESNISISRAGSRKHRRADWPVSIVVPVEQIARFHLRTCAPRPALEHRLASLRAPGCRGGEELPRLRSSGAWAAVAHPPAVESGTYSVSAAA